MLRKSKKNANACVCVVGVDETCLWVKVLTIRLD
jgi:hypothetical protein